MKLPLILTLVLTSPAVSIAQNRCAASASPDVNLSVESDKSRHPLKIIVEPVDSNLLGEPIYRFKSGEAIHLRISLTNTSAEPLSLVDFTGEYHQHRLYLVRGQETVSYQEGLCELLKKLDERFVGGSMGGHEIKAGNTVRVGFLNLSKWYGPLEPGRYILTVERRFWFTKSLPAVESEPVRFEVVP